MTVNRETVRDAAVTLLSAALVGTGKPAQAVLGYQAGDFGGQTPVVTVTSAGIFRKPLTFQGGRATIYLNAHIFVLYALADGTWTEAQCEDRLDLIEKTIAETVQANRKTANWESWEYADRTGTGSTMIPNVEIGGLEYRMEVIPMKLEVYA